MDNELRQTIERLEAEIEALKSDRIPTVDRASKRRDRRQIVAGLALFVVAVMVGGTVSASALSGINTVDSGDIKNGQVKSADIGTEQVYGNDIKNGAVASADVADNSLTGTDIKESALSIPGSAIIDNAITGARVADGSLTGADLGAGTVTSSELGTITTRNGTATVITGNSNTAYALCLSGETAIGGGFQNNAYGGLHAAASHMMVGANGWQATAYNASQNATGITAYVYCLAP
ncbi:hypothetical protein EFK50_21425 [Nocardioides marmoriginsengisoli]|uniref:Uncharacterized protein n=1 Tax=Nocardioides marmoriginsengisoli TaxID=661483 RepID=A0A3N0C907_9ACTN|nr:hypothetical protein [Nocardioides marmoriginsengisoli]RNL59952.1 hypothetical protein EFK50_21425 [Nocardioides marmoriginsengisoli]